MVCQKNFCRWVIFARISKKFFFSSFPLCFATFTLQSKEFWNKRPQSTNPTLNECQNEEFRSLGRSRFENFLELCPKPPWGLRHPQIYSCLFNCLFRDFVAQSLPFTRSPFTRFARLHILFAPPLQICVRQEILPQHDQMNLPAGISLHVNENVYMCNLKKFFIFLPITWIPKGSTYLYHLSALQWRVTLFVPADGPGRIQLRAILAPVYRTQILHL